jgi:hypothetical protein
MKLVCEPVFRRPPNRPVDVYFDAEEELQEESPVAPALEVLEGAETATAIAAAAAVTSSVASQEPAPTGGDAADAAQPIADPLPDDDHPPPLESASEAPDLTAAPNPSSPESRPSSKEASGGREGGRSRNRRKSRGKRRGGSGNAGRK